MLSINKQRIKKTRYDYLIVGVIGKVGAILSNIKSITVSNRDNSLLIDNDTDFSNADIISFFKSNFIDYKETIEFISNKVAPKPYVAIF